MEVSRQTEHCTNKETKEAVNPRMIIHKYLISRSPITDQAIMQVILLLYSVKHKIKLLFNNNNILEHAESDDLIFNRLLNAATSNKPNAEFNPYLIKGYMDLITIEESDFDNTYISLIIYIIREYAGFKNSITFPPIPLLTTVANIVSKYKCQTVGLCQDNFASLSWFLDEKVDVFCSNDWNYVNILRDVVLDELKSSNLQNDIRLSRYDAFISFTGVDYSLSKGFENFCFWQVTKGNLQSALLESILDTDKADLIIFLIHHDLANHAGYRKLRKRLCDEGILDMVITLPVNTFVEPKVSTSLLVMDRNKSDDIVKFIDSTCVFAKYDNLTTDIDIIEYVPEESKADITYDEMSKLDWTFNAHVYIQDAKCNEEQGLVPLKDIVTFRSGKNESPICDEVIMPNSLRDLNFIEYYNPFPGDNYYTIKGPAVIFNLDNDSTLRVSVYESDQERSVFMSCYTLFPNTKKVLPQYLAYALLSDKSFTNYVRHLLEDYAEADGITPEYILNRKIPFHQDLRRQYEIVEPLMSKEHISSRYNIILVFADERSLSNDYMSALTEKHMRVLGTASDIIHFQSLFNKYASDAIPAQDRVDAVIVDADIKHGLNNEESEYDGLIELSYIIDKSRVPFYLISKLESKELEKQTNKRALSYFTQNSKKRFFHTGFDNFKVLLDSLRHELESVQSDDSILRNKYIDFYKAADWLDSQRPEMNFAVNITRELKMDIACTQEEMSKSVNDLRILTQNLIEWIQDVNLAPRDLNPGGVAILFRDKSFGDYKYTDSTIMDRSLASMLATLYDVGNEGSHKFLFTDLYRRTAILCLMAFVQWVYEKRELFTRRHDGYYVSRTLLETQAFVDVVNCDESEGKPYYYTRDVHLGVGKIINIKAGDKVRVTNWTLEDQPRKDLGVIYYSNQKNWSKVNC